MRIATGYVLGTALLVAAAPAFAGGPVNPVPEIEPVAPPAVAPATPFAGAYVGADLGYGFAGKDEVGGTVPEAELDLSGALGGLHVGYRWQPGVFVWGIELGIEGGDLKDSDGDSSSELKHAATLRAISGWTPNDDTLLYGFAGVTRAKFDYAAGAPINFDGDVSATGYVVGLGAERLLNDRWSVRGEYRYSDFGKERIETATGTSNVTPEYHSLRVGVNYRF